MQLILIELQNVEVEYNLVMIKNPFSPIQSRQPHLTHAVVGHIEIGGEAEDSEWVLVHQSSKTCSAPHPLLPSLEALSAAPTSSPKVSPPSKPLM